MSGPEFGTPGREKRQGSPIRLGSAPTLILVRADLVDEITRVKMFEGMPFTEMERYREEFRPPDPHEE